MAIRKISMKAISNKRKKKHGMVIKLSNYIIYNLVYLFTTVIVTVNCITNDQFTVTRTNTDLTDNIVGTQSNRATLMTVGSTQLFWSANGNGEQKLYTKDGIKASDMVSDGKSGDADRYGADIGSDLAIYTHSDYVVKYTFSTVSGNYFAFGALSYTDIAGDNHYLKRIPGTNYVVRPDSTDCIVIDGSTLGVTLRFTITNPSKTWSDTYFAFTHFIGGTNNFVIPSHNMRDSHVMDRTSLSVVVTWARPAGKETDEWYKTHYDDYAGGNVLWAACSTTKRIFKISTSSSTMAILGDIFTATSIDMVPAMIDVPNSNLLLMTDRQIYTGTNSTLMVITKTLPISYQDITGYFDIGARAHSVVHYHTATNTITLGIAAHVTNYYFRTYTIVRTERCSVKNSNGVCTTCQASHYLDTNNICLKTTEIPSGYGADLATGTVQPCAANNCYDCKSNKDICVSCNSGFYYYETGTPQTQCYSSANIPSTWGKQASGYQLITCQVANCDNCKSLYTSCQTCLSSHPYHKESSPPYSYCYNSMDIPSPWGKQASGYQLSTCQAPNCEYCKSLYTYCQTCLSSHPYRKESNTPYSSCYNSTNIPDGWGKAAASYVLIECSVTNCSNCRDNYTQCETCMTGKYYKEEIGFKSVCFDRENIESGYGIVNQYIVGLCRVTGCSNCTDSFLNCASCKPDRYYIEDYGFKSNCYIENDIPSGFGKQASGYLLKRCTTLNCGTCQQNYMECDVCEDGFFYKEPSGIKSRCMNQEDIPDGWGKEHGTYLLKECILTGCHQCSMDHMTCMPCAGLWYAQTPGQLTGCVKYADISAGMGVKSENLIAPCTVTGCHDCKANYSNCVSCSNSTYFLEDNDYKKNCYSLTSIPSEYGIQNGTNLLKNCSTPNCLNCQANFSLCTACKDGFFYKEPSGVIESCLRESSIPEGWGKQGSTYLLKTCTITGCMSCKRKYSVCESCYPNMWYYGPVNNLSGCYQDSFIASGYGKKPGQYSLEPCRVEGCDNCWNNFSNCLTCQSNRYHIENNKYKERCYSVSEVPEGYGRQIGLSLLAACRINDCKTCQSDVNVCDECKTGRWLLKDDLRNTTSCHASEDIPIHWGKVSGTNQLAICKSKGCLNCFEDYTDCKSCGPDVWYIGDILYPTGCYSELEIPSGYGKNGTDKKLAECSLLGCIFCRNNFEVCEQCTTDRYHVESKPPISRCYSLQEIPDGLGPNINSQELKSCIVSGCLKCTSNYESCQTCRSNFYFVPYPDRSVSCFSDSTIPNGYGIAPSSRELSKCQEPGCQNCKEDYTKCQSCLPAYWYLEKEDGLKNCYSIEVVPEGYGKHSGMRISKCSVRNCGNCYADYNTCLACNDVSYVSTLSIPIDNCYLDYEAPPGLGVREGQKLVVPCRIPNCNNCSLSYSTCDLCADNQYYSEALGGLKYCYEPTNLPIGYGKVDPNGKLLKRCETPGCLECFEDYSMCIKCNPNYFYLPGGQSLVCYSRDMVPAGYGINPASKKLEVCSVEHCRLCREQFNSCDACVTDFYLYNERCVEEIPPPRDEARDVVGTKKGLLGMNFNPERRSLRFTFDDRVSKANVFQTSALIKLIGFVNLKTKKVVTLPPILQSPAVRYLSDGFELLVDLGDFDGPFQLMLEDDSNLGYLKQNMQVKGLNYISKISSPFEEDHFKSALYGTSIVVTYTRLLINFAGRVVTQSFSVVLDKLFSNWNLILLLGEDSLTSLNYYLKTISKMQSYNPWESGISTKCLKSHFLEDRDLDCSFLDNYGTDLFFIYILLAFCTVIQIVARVFRHKVNFNRLGRYYGLAFWMKRSNSLLLQIALLSFVHFRYMSEGDMTAQFVMYCLPLLGYYLFALGLTMWRTYIHFNHFKRQKENLRDKDIEHLQLKMVPMLDFAFEDLNVRNIFGLLLPVIYQIKSITLALTTVLMIGSPKLQLLTVLVVESVYMVAMTLGRPFKYISETFVEKLNSLQVLALVVVKLYALGGSDTSSKLFSVPGAASLIVLATYFICVPLTLIFVLAISKNRYAELYPQALLPNVMDKPIETVTPTIADLRLESREASNFVFKDTIKYYSHQKQKW